MWILGGYQSDFARNLTREGRDFADLTARGRRRRRWTPPGSTPPTIGVVHVGNAFGEMFAGQGHLGAMPATVVDGLWDTPSSRHEAACASGSVAMLAAIADLRSGAYDTALVLGVELEKTVPGDTAAAHLGAAAWIGHEGEDAKFMWPHMFARVADEYDRRYGLDESHLRAIAQLNFANAATTPTRRPATGPCPTCGERRRDDDGSTPSSRAGCAGSTAARSPTAAPASSWSPTTTCATTPTPRPIGRIEGWGHRTVGLGPAAEARPLRRRPLRACRTCAAPCSTRSSRARVTLDDLDGIEVHDCFTPSEYLAIDHIGLTGPGESWKAIENGEIEIGGRLPINPSGGLIGGGHPVGATGVRMLLDAAKQVSGTAGDYQVEGARTFGTLNFGGSTATTVSFVVGACRRADRRTHGVTDMDVEVVGKFLSTLPEDDDHPYRTGPWRPQTTEWDADDLTSSRARSRRDLDGVYLRNTENPLHPALKIYHPFDGDGMIHVVGFRDGKAFYRNRFVRTDGLRPRRTRPAGRCGPGSPSRSQVAKRDYGWGARTR